MGEWIVQRLKGGGVHGEQGGKGDRASKNSDVECWPRGEEDWLVN